MLVLLLWLKSGSGGVNRWFVLGPIAVQPSEFVKFSTVFSVAYLLREPPPSRTGLGLLGFMLPLAVMLVPFFLIVKQPDLGTALILALIFMPMLLAAGLKRSILIGTGVLFISGVLLLVLSFSVQYYTVNAQVLRQLQTQEVSPALIQHAKTLNKQRFFTRNALQKAAGLLADEKGFASLANAARRPLISLVLRPYQQRRITTFLNPDKDPLGSGYHVIQSKVAVGSGGLSGKGYLNSTQGSLNFLPARHTDFVFSIFAEEWGLIGSVLLLALYGLWLWRSIVIAQESTDRFSAFAVLGVVLIISVQLMINTGMTLGMLPVVGVPLPFFSYGGSSLVSSMMGAAFVLNVRMRRFNWA